MQSYKDESKSKEDVPVCLCGKKFESKLVSECYDGTGVGCDECGKNIPKTDNVYHCPADKKNILHTNGYDLCLPCYTKKSDEVNTDNILFQIWFIINCLNKDLYETLSSKYQINSRKSLLAKSTFEIFQFLMSVNWNTFNDGSSMKLFCDKYDKLKEKHLSLKNNSYKVKSYQYQNQNQNQSADLFSSMFGGGISEGSGVGGGAVPTTSSTSFNWGNNTNNNINNFGNNNAAFGSNYGWGGGEGGTGSSMDKNIGFSVGGGPKDMNTARLNIENHQIPQINSVSFQGIFNDYYFDTNPINENEQKQHQQMELEGKEKELPLFYPSYTCSKAAVPKSLLMVNQQNDIIENDFSDYYQKEYNYFLTVGLNSNIKQKDFKRKKLNLCVVLDISGSMSSSFGGNNSWSFQSIPSDGKTKMRVANECLLLLLTHLNADDRFGLVLFNNYAESKIKMDLMKNIKMEEIEQILDIGASGGTNFEAGYKQGIKMYNNIQKDNQYENRLIFLTDAHPNEGSTDAESLLNLVSSAANQTNNNIYTTFIGVGIDFNSNLISKIIDVRGANQFSVHTNKEFKKKLYLEFDYFVSPMVFNLCLTLFCEGSEYGAIDKVYGSDNINIRNGEIMKIKTLFPSPPNDCGQVKGGIILIKLKKENMLKQLAYFCEVTFEDKFGNIMKNKQKIFFNNPNFFNNEFYANLGVRKAILLIQYILLIKDWIKNGLINPAKYKNVFNQFKIHYNNEMRFINDNTLNKEIKMLDKLINW